MDRNSTVTDQPIVRESSCGLVTEEASSRDVEPAPLMRQALWGLLALGIAARAVRFLLRFPLWDDESFLCVNFIDSSYAKLMGPLQFSQVAPLLYLWTEWTSVKLFGFHEWSLRLPAFVSSLASLWLFRDLARRLLRGWAEVLAVGLFAVSYPMIRYAAEGKQYGTDQFVALLLWWFAVRYMQQPTLRWPIWTLAALAPVAVGMSFPAAFVGGAVSLLLGWKMLRNGRQPAEGNLLRGMTCWLPWGTFNGTLLGGFLGFTWLAMQAHQPAQQVMDECWRTNFPPLTEPWRLPYWLLDAHAGVYLAFPVGGAKFASLGTLLLVVAGMVHLWRRGGSLLLAMFWLPAALHLAAAGMKRYPYGGHVKFSMYAGPAICLVAAAGGAWLLSLAAKRLRSSPWAAARGALSLNPGLAVVTAVALLGVGSMARDFWRPTKTLSDQRLRDLARWFWFNAPAEAEAACLKSDLGIDFQPATFRELGWAAMYLCNQKIYSPRHASGHAVDWDRIGLERPLWCVEFRSGFQPYDAEARDAWLRQMQEHYTLVGRESYPLPMYDKRERNLLTTEHWEVYRFVPRADVARPFRPELLR